MLRRTLALLLGLAVGLGLAELALRAADLPLARIRALGARVDGIARSRVRIAGSPAVIARVAELTGIGELRFPLVPVPVEGAGVHISESVALVGALPLRIFEVRYLDMIGRCHKAGEPFGVVCLSEGSCAPRLCRCRMAMIQDRLRPKSVVARDVYGVRKMFVSSQPASIAMMSRDIDALHSLIRTSNLEPQVAEFIAHELDRADRIDCASSMLDYVTIGSWVLFRLDPLGEVRFAKLELPTAAPTTNTRTLVTTAIGAALIGLRQDQSIEWRMRDDRRIERLTVLMILPARSWLALRSP